MRKIIHVLLLLISCNAFTQKIDLDKEPFPVEYLTLPENNALIGLTTYNVLLYSSPATLAALGLNDAALEFDFKLIGYTYTKDENADFLLEVSIDRVNVISTSIESKRYDTKNAQGVVVQTEKYYVVSKIVAPTYIKLVNKQNSSELEYLSFATIDTPFQFQSQEFSTFALAESYVSTLLVADRNKFFAKSYQEKFNATFNGLHKKYCYTFTNSTDLFWKVDLKKSPEYAAFNEELLKAKAIFNTMKATQDLAPLKEQLAPSMKYWSDNAAQIVVEDKKARKLKYAYLIALARTQYWMEMFNECEETCNAIISNDYDDGDGKTMKVMMGNVKKYLAVNNATTRHFMRTSFNSTDKFRVAGNIKMIAVVQEHPLAPKGFTVLPGYLIDFEKNRIDGELWVKNLDQEYTFMPENNTLFVYQTPEGYKKMSISADNIDKLVIGRTANFECIMYKNKVGAPEKMQLFRVLYENEKIRLLKLYRTPSTGGNISIKNDIKQIWMGTDLCIMKTSDGIIQPIVGVSALKTSENTAAFYSDCPVLQQKITTGEIKNLNQVDNQKIAADFFVKNCQ